MIRAGRPWCDEPNATMAAIQEARRALRASADSPSAWPSMAEFYAGRSVLLTGGSGFMGRVIVEFLLRCCPDIGSVYLVLRHRKGVSPEKRLLQLTNVALFDRLREEQPDALSKLVVVSGDVATPGLGLSAEDRALLVQEVSVVFHCAASVRFDDPFQKAVFTNLRSTRDLIQLAKEMPKLKVLVHVSTAYAIINQSVIQERVYPTQLDWRDVIRWAEKLPESDLQGVDWLGHKIRDFQPNSYTFTKALAERLVEEEAADLPTVITRPSIVINAFSDPIPGWVDNLNGPMGLFAAGSKGIMRVWPHGNATMDTIPVDVAVKIILLASWMRGIGKPLRPHAERLSAVEVVNVTVGTDLGPNIEECKAALVPEVISRTAYPGTVRWPGLVHFSSSSDIRYKAMSLYEHVCFPTILDLLARIAGQKPRALAVCRTITAALQALEPFTITSFSFDMRTQEYLQSVVHPKDDKTLDFLKLYTIRDTKENFYDLQCDLLRGVLVYCLREEHNPERNYPIVKRLKWVSYVYHAFMFALFCGIVYLFLRLRWQ